MDNENEYSSVTSAGGAEYSPFAEPEKRHKKKRSGKVFRVIAIILLCVLLSGAAGIGGTVLMHNYYAGQGRLSEDGARIAALVEGNRSTAMVQTASVDTGKLMTASQVYAANVNSTVGIRTSISMTNFWGYRTTSAASGSGFILTENGYILTNYHVIQDSNSITVTDYDGKEYEAKIVGYDESNDIAVLKVEAEGLSPVILGSSKALSVGEDVAAIGNPLGELTFSLTRGCVSALDRTVTLSDSNTMTLIQTDCAINSGNSGGALFNMYGEVVGITNAKFSSSSSGASIDNIGFAIPIDSVRGIFESIIEKGYASTPYIGVTVSTVAEDSRSYGLPAGAAIQSVTEDGPAAKAGIQAYDIITAVNGNPVADKSDVTEAVRASKPGDVLALELYRQGQKLTVNVTVGEKISSQETAKEEAAQQQEQEQQQQISPYYSDPFGGSSPFGDFFRYFF